jgi:hypothetical protein
VGALLGGLRFNTELSSTTAPDTVTRARCHSSSAVCTVAASLAHGGSLVVTVTTSNLKDSSRRPMLSLSAADDIADPNGRALKRRAAAD